MFAQMSTISYPSDITSCDSSLKTLEGKVMSDIKTRAPLHHLSKIPYKV